MGKTVYWVVVSVISLAIFWDFFQTGKVEGISLLALIISAIAIYLNVFVGRKTLLQDKVLLLIQLPIYPQTEEEKNKTRIILNGIQYKAIPKEPQGNWLLSQDYTLENGLKPHQKAEATELLNGKHEIINYFSWFRLYVAEDTNTFKTILIRQCSKISSEKQKCAHEEPLACKVGISKNNIVTLKQAITYELSYALSIDS